MYDDILKDLETNLSFTYGNNITQYDSGYICDVFSEIADSNVDIYTSDLFEWGKSNMYYIDEATKEFGNPNDICTETFLQIGPFDNLREASNALSYIKTKFFRALLFYNRHSLNISQESFSLIPLQNFNEVWSDDKLYKKYGLNKEEIDFIESMIKPME